MVDTLQQINTYDDESTLRTCWTATTTPATDVITDFVQIQTNGSDSELYVDTTGTATFGPGQHIAAIQGVTGLTDEVALVTAGTVIAA